MCPSFCLFHLYPLKCKQSPTAVCAPWQQDVRNCPLLHTLQASFLSTHIKGFWIASETHFSYNRGPISSSWIYLLTGMGSNLFQGPLETWIPFSAFYRDESCLLENVNGLLQAQSNDLFLNGIASSHDLFSWTKQQHIHELSIQLLF